MGSELVGYILEGPRDLDDAPAYRSAIATARDRILGIAADADDVSANGAGRVFVRFAPTPLDGVSGTLVERENRMLRDETDGLLQKVLADSTALFPWVPLGDTRLTRKLATRIACRAVRQFRLLWSERYFVRDMMARLSPSDSEIKILVAAGQTNGDPLTGQAYSIVRLAELLGVLGELDIG